ncbi:hypothetical protein LJC68_07330 [Bacteroidales bacterium OttesenSCG-928-B11]|nr:hypothetical protein [Bacteroidales bacterium OttesenSCG-928-B11]MDL2326468.1 hypothetical protein [Bacteroidales bacterium OttesenSCG-928-A14]
MESINNVKFQKYSSEEMNQLFGGKKETVINYYITQWDSAGCQDGLRGGYLGSSMTTYDVDRKGNRTWVSEERDPSGTPGVGDHVYRPC